MGRSARVHRALCTAVLGLSLWQVCFLCGLKFLFFGSQRDKTKKKKLRYFNLDQRFLKHHIHYIIWMFQGMQCKYLCFNNCWRVLLGWQCRGVSASGLHWSTRGDDGECTAVNPNLNSQGDQIAVLPLKVFLGVLILTPSSGASCALVSNTWYPALFLQWSSDLKFSYLCFSTSPRGRVPMEKPVLYSLCVGNSVIRGCGLFMVALQLECPFKALHCVRHWTFQPCFQRSPREHVVHTLSGWGLSTPHLQERSPQPCPGQRGMDARGHCLSPGRQRRWQQTGTHPCSAPPCCGAAIWLVCNQTVL